MTRLTTFAGALMVLAGQAGPVRHTIDISPGETIEIRLETGAKVRSKRGEHRSA